MPLEIGLLLLTFRPVLGIAWLSCCCAICASMNHLWSLTLFLWLLFFFLFFLRLLYFFLFFVITSLFIFDLSYLFFNFFDFFFLVSDLALQKVELAVNESTCVAREELLYRQVKFFPLFKQIYLDGHVPLSKFVCHCFDLERERIILTLFSSCQFNRAESVIDEPVVTLNVLICDFSAFHSLFHHFSS